MVFVNDKCISKKSFKLNENDTVKVKEHKNYVGRGAYKLLAAIEIFNLDFKNLVVADFGASTGGFSQVVLEAGAKKVFAIDVGHEQIDISLLKNEKLINMEGINIRHGVPLPEKVDFAVCDVSFISLELVIKEILSSLKDSGKAVILFKPQFEVGKENLGKNAIVSKENGFIALSNFYKHCVKNKIYWHGWSLCPLKGRDGNQEYLIFIDLLLNDEQNDFYCLNQGEKL